MEASGWGHARTPLARRTAKQQLGWSVTANGPRRRPRYRRGKAAASKKNGVAGGFSPDDRNARHAVVSALMGTYPPDCPRSNGYTMPAGKVRLHDWCEVSVAGINRIEIHNAATNFKLRHYPQMLAEVCQ